MRHPIPTKALQQRTAVLGKTGSGKTYAIRSAVEGLLDNEARVCIVDPTGAWFGLRSSVSGARAGYPVVIFGGEHADLPLGSAHGEAIAEVIGTSSTPSIIDTSLMKVGERTRFFADFADALVRKNKGPLHLVIDEAHLFMPQGKVSDPQSGAMLHAANNMVSLGRSRGLRIIMITQRPAKLHKDSLTQANTLVAMRLIAPQDRNAIKAWIEDNADEGLATDIISSLATLKTGQGWVWAPELKMLEKVTFPKIHTYDSGRAPDGSEAEAAKVLAPIDLELISKRLEKVSAAALADDPRRLRARIAELERQVKVGKPVEVNMDAIEQRAYQKAMHEANRAKLNNLATMRRALHRSIDNVLDVDTVTKSVMKTVTKSVMKPVTKVVTKVTPDLNGKLPIGESAILSACIQFDGARRDQLTVLTGYKRSSRDAYISRLKDKGYVEIRDDLVKPTATGAMALPSASPLPTGPALQDYWFAKLPVGEAAILKVLVARGTQPMAREDLSTHTEYKRSSRDAYLSRLSARALVVEPSRGMVMASETLF